MGAEPGAGHQPCHLRNRVVWATEYFQSEHCPSSSSSSQSSRRHHNTVSKGLGERSPNSVTLLGWVILGKAPNQVFPFSQENSAFPTIEVGLDYVGDPFMLWSSPECRSWYFSTKGNLHFEERHEAQWTKNITLPPSLPWTLCLRARLTNLSVTYWHAATSSLSYVHFTCRVRQQVIKYYTHVTYI